MCLFFNTNIGLAVYPSYIHNAAYMAGVSSNAFLSTLALCCIFTNLYASLISSKKEAVFQKYYNSLALLMAAFSLVVPTSYECLVYYLLYALYLYACVRVIIHSCIRTKAGDKTYHYPAFAYILMVICSVSDTVMAAFNIEHVSLVTFFMPVFLILHGTESALQYGNSIKKTQKLSASLSDTIERINHSNNALMCTQMKSEFLYRSLDLISKKCDEDPFTAEDLTVSLSKYLRHTLNFQQLQGIVPLSNEIELTKAFVSIEKERYPKLKVEYKFPDPLPDFHIPPLSIQPLVENAIEHGFTEDMPEPKVTLTIIPYRDYYHIDVSDNGSGMDEDVAASLTDSLNDSARIGIYNIHTRLINLFGKGLVIQSAPGVGTSVSFVVPPDAEAYLREKEAGV
ncbi:MAG: histidine kinase [Lachnospiraceae bacterium]|nr:histidine kinase [Lachnospiraceae bacterium]